VVLRICIVEITRKYDSCTVDQDVQLWLILFFTLGVIGPHTLGRFHHIVLLNKFIFDSFDQIFALIIVGDISDNDGGLRWKLRSHPLQSNLVLADQDDVGSLVQVPKAYSLADAAGGTRYDDTLVQKVVSHRLLVGLEQGTAADRRLTCGKLTLLGIVATGAIVVKSTRTTWSIVILEIGLLYSRSVIGWKILLPTWCEVQSLILRRYESLLWLLMLW
jgi:hypothetical protein